MKTNISAYARAYFTHMLLALLGLTPILIEACSNPNSAPATNSVAVSYTAPAFFSTTTLGDTSNIPYPCGFPSLYLQQKLGLTDTQVVAIQNLQDSLRLALQSQLAAQKAAGTLNRDTVRALRLQYQTALQNGIANILTAAQLATLQSIVPPDRPRDAFPLLHFGPPGRGDFGHRNDHDAEDSLTAIAPAARDSIMLVNMEKILAAASDTLSANQITLIQNLQATIEADTTLTPAARRAQFDAQLQTILTAQQLIVLQKQVGDSDDQRHRRR